MWKERWQGADADTDAGVGVWKEADSVADASERIAICQNRNILVGHEDEEW